MDEEDEEDEDEDDDDSDFDSDDDSDDDFFFEEEDDDVDDGAKQKLLQEMAMKAGLIDKEAQEKEQKKKDEEVPKEIRKQVIFSNSLLKWGMFDICIMFYEKKCVLEFQQSVILTMNLDHL